jgi:hypothetical protein
MNDLRVHDDGPIQLAAPDLERLIFQSKSVPPFSLDLTVSHGLLGHRMLH